MKAEYLIGEHDMPEGMSAQDPVDFLMHADAKADRYQATEGASTASGLTRQLPEA
jgi:hypothetical protein